MTQPDAQPGRPSISLALFDGVRWLIGLVLMVDGGRSFVTPDASLLGLFVRWPGGAALPAAASVVLGIALLWRRRPSVVMLASFALLVAVNIGEFFLLRETGLIAAELPFSLMPLAVLVGAIARVFHDDQRAPAAYWWWSAGGTLLVAPLLLLGHLLSFGGTDYARPADAIVVFGCRAYSDGTASLALSDRFRHGIELYHRGLAPVLLMSGGPGEPEVMRHLAMEAGVPASAIVMDEAGLDTRATLANLRFHPYRRIVAVSHYYHLARIKLTARRLGLICATSPCPMTRRLRREPWFVVRECIAFVAYYLIKA